MNMWQLSEELVALLKGRFEAFLRRSGRELSSECLLPDEIQGAMADSGAEIRTVRGSGTVVWVDLRRGCAESPWDPCGSGPSRALSRRFVGGLIASSPIVPELFGLESDRRRTDRSSRKESHAPPRRIFQLERRGRRAG